MANTKISALSAASALAGTEELAGVQSAANAKVTIDQIKTYCRTRADVIVNGHVSTSVRIGSQSNRIVRTAAGVWYAFFTEGAGATIYYNKSTNYGVTWSTPIQIKATSAVRGIACWFDKWTPGDSGTLIHLAYYESTNHDVFYRALDTSDDSLGTEASVFAGASATNSGVECISIAKMRGGNINVAFNIDGGTEFGFYRSGDAGATFATGDASGAMLEAAADYFLLYPGNEADNQDAYLVYWDISADEISLKVYDDSGAALGTETAIATTMVELVASAATPQFAGAVRNSDGHLILVAWSAADLANADLRCFDINGAASITEMTNVVLNSTDDQAMCAVGIDTTADTIYCFYAGKSDGTETAYTSLNVYYKTSTDGGTTWGSETALTSTARTIQHLNCALEFASGEFAVSYVTTTTGAAVALLTSALK
jgi:hypothetical protein